MNKTKTNDIPVNKAEAINEEMKMLMANNPALAIEDLKARVELKKAEIEMKMLEMQLENDLAIAKIKANADRDVAEIKAAMQEMVARMQFDGAFFKAEAARGKEKLPMPDDLEPNSCSSVLKEYKEETKVAA